MDGLDTEEVQVKPSPVLVTDSVADSKPSSNEEKEALESKPGGNPKFPTAPHIPKASLHSTVVSRSGLTSVVD